LALLASLAAAAAARADLAPPPGTKVIDPRVGFEGVEQQAGYAFFLRCQRGDGNPFAAPTTWAEVKDGEAFTLPGSGRRIAALQLVAVPRKEVAKPFADDPKLPWLTDRTPDVLRADVDPPSTVGRAGDRDAPVTRYRVRIREDRLTVERVAEDTRRGAAPAGELVPVLESVRPVAEDTRRGAPALPPVLVAVGAASLAVIGLWLVRRRGPGRA
jgi:hypothetical protein